MRQNQSQNHIAPKLPKALLDQVQSGASSQGRRGGPQPTRKERRKQERQQKKVPSRPRPVLHKYRHNTDNTDNADSSRDDDHHHLPSPPARKPAKTASRPAAKPAVSTNGNPLKSILKTTNKADPVSDSDDDGTPPPSAPRLSRAVKDKLAEDDAEIAALEKKLGMKGKKKLPKSFEEDGLDGLLDGLDGDDDDDGKKRKRSEDDEWLRQKRRRVQQANEKQPKPSEEEEEEEEEEGFQDDGDDDEGSINDEMDAIDDFLHDLGEESADSADDDDDDDEDDNIEDEDGDADDMDDQDMDDEDGFEDFDQDGDEDDEEPMPTAPRQRENPYVAPVSATTTTTATPAPAGKYIPPSLRGPPSSDSEALQRLRRQVQGLLNRLSEANLLSILQSVEKIYADNPRQYVTTTLIDLLIGLICDRTSLMDTFLILHAGFIAGLYKVIGIDFGAQVIERIVNDFDKHYSPSDSDPTQGKEAANLISLLSELYNFQVIGANLVFDYLRLFLTSLSEANTELLLKIVRNSGPQLRSDDPSALKDIVILLQKQVAAVGEANLSVRTKFMIETINNLKNNRMKTGVAASTVVSEHTIRMKKTLGSLNNRSTLKASEPLRIGLADIRDTSKKGKWWLVGASWMDPGKHATSATNDANDKRRTKGEDFSSAVDPSAPADERTTDLHQLARQQGMNTDIRRAIFVTIMSASDYKDAHVRLLKLNFKKTQELEIPRVLIQCVGAEGSYNPYYKVVAKQFCGEKRMLKAFQFGIWDVFKRLGERPEEDSGDEDDDEAEDFSLRKLVNLARFFADLVVDAGLPLSCLKVLNFAYAQPKTTTFLEVFFTSIITSAQKKMKKSKWELSLQDIFAKAQDVPEMVQGLRYFIEKFVMKAGLAKDNKEKKAIRDGCRSIIETLTLPVTGGGEDMDDGGDLTSGSDSG